MLWGQLAAVPALSFWGVILLAAVLGVLGGRRLRSGRPRTLGMIALGLALLVPISARALPFTFTNGTVADATQVNANFAALVAGQGLAPTATSNLVDLGPGGNGCPGQAPSVIPIAQAIGSDGILRPFSIPTGQTLVLTSLNITFMLGSGSANHGIFVEVLRSSLNGGQQFDEAIVTLDAQGGGSAAINLGSGSALAAGMTLCATAHDLVGNVNVVPTVYAHGFMTTQ
jgi:hypothetical protein